MKIQNRDGTRTMDVEPGLAAARYAMEKQAGYGYCVSGITGTVGAMAANVSVFALRNGEAMQGKSGEAAGVLVIDRMRLKFTGLSTSTGLVGERLALYRGGGALQSGGTALVPSPKRANTRASAVRATLGATANISTTAALTVTGIVFEAAHIRAMMIQHNVLAGGFDEVIWEFSDYENAGLVLLPQQLVAIRAPVGTNANRFWQLQVDVDYREINRLPNSNF